MDGDDHRMGSGRPPPVSTDPHRRHRALGGPVLRLHEPPRRARTAGAGSRPPGVGTDPTPPPGVLSPWKRWTTKAREATWAEQPRRSCWTLAPERMPPTAQRQFLWAETRRRAQACGTPINRGVPPKCTHLASASNSHSPRPPPKGHHHVNPGWRALLAKGDGFSPNTARRSGPSPVAFTIEELAWAVLDRCTSPPTGEQLAEWLYSLLWAADTTTRRPAEATWPIIDRVRYCAGLARRFAADQPMGELSGAVRAVAIGRWPPTEHGAWLTQCRRLARAITTGQGVSAASRGVVETPAGPGRPTVCANRRSRAPEHRKRISKPATSSYATPIGADTGVWPAPARPPGEATRRPVQPAERTGSPGGHQSSAASEGHLRPGGSSGESAPPETTRPGSPHSAENPGLAGGTGSSRSSITVDADRPGVCRSLAETSPQQLKRGGPWAPSQHSQEGHTSAVRVRRVTVESNRADLR